MGLFIGIANASLSSKLIDDIIDYCYISALELRPILDPPGPGFFDMSGGFSILGP